MACPLSRDDAHLVAGVVQAPAALLGRGDDVLHAHPEATGQVDPGLDREAHAGLDRVGLALDHIRRLVGGQPDAVADAGDGVPVEVEAFVEDDPAQTLVRVSEHLDLLVCGSRGYGPLRAVLLGGVSRRVAVEAHCPVIVLPRGVRASVEALMAQAAGALVAG
jgi:nucleotide-binding universal stress UspA family protein